MPTTPSSGYMTGRSINISSNTPQRADNYEFKGWCTVTTNDDSCSSQTLQSSDSYSFTDINYKANNVLNLYAMWKKNSCDGYKIMQDVLYWEDELTTTGATIEACDIRDYKTYFVSRLADGNIWMTQNLDFEITSEPLTSETSDLTAYNTGGYIRETGYTKEGNIIKWTPTSTAVTSGRAVPVSTSTGTVSGVTNWINDNYAPYSAEGGDVYMYTSNTTDDDTIYTSLSSCIAASHTEAECKHYHRGNYYNWSAAVASNNTNVTELTTQYNTAQNSICPAGWRLPTGAKSEFLDDDAEQLYLLLVSDKLIYDGGPLTKITSLIDDIDSGPLYLKNDYGGVVTQGQLLSLSNMSIYGGYWSSSVLSDDEAYGIVFVMGDHVIRDGHIKGYGYNVRCVAR